MCGGYLICKTVFLHDAVWIEGENKKSFRNIFLMLPQTLALGFLLYYACTFGKGSSAFVHPMLAEAYPHQCIILLLTCAVLSSGFRAAMVVRNTADVEERETLTLAISFVDMTACRVREIVDCERREDGSVRGDVWLRVLHMVGTLLLLIAMTSVAILHKLNFMIMRVRSIDLSAFHPTEHRTRSPHATDTTKGSPTHDQRLFSIEPTETPTDLEEKMAGR
ncbi:TPA: hypothetical protein N0F65_009259, partial [Lagenidium giganteum]